MIFRFQHKQPIFYSIIGFMFLLGWLLSAYILWSGTVFPGEYASGITKILITVYNYFLNGKLYTLLCFILGFQLYNVCEKNFRFKFQIIGSFVVFIISILVSYFTALSLILIPLILFRLFLIVFIKQHKFSVLHLLILSILLTIALSFFSSGLLFTTPSFIELFKSRLSFSNNSGLMVNLLAPDNFIFTLYGLVVIIIGFLAGKTKWMMEYPFHYNELKKLFKYSLVLFLLWLLLNFFEVYLYITKWPVGEMFYTLDALSINLIMVFMYLFILISLENYRWGLRILKGLQNTGRNWLLNLSILSFYIVLYELLSIKLALHLSLLIGLLAFFMSALASSIIRKIWISTNPIRKK